MANFELQLIRSMLEAKDGDKAWDTVLTESGNRNMCVSFPEVYEMVQKYKMKYGKLPSLDTVQKKFVKLDFDKPQEPLKFYIEEVKQAYIYSEMARINSDVLVKHLQAGDPIKAYSETRAELDMLSTMRRMASEINLSSNYEDRILRYDKRRSQALVNGVPTGWGKLDQETTGFQDAELTFLVSRMGSFKTWSLVSWMCYSWEQGFVPLVFSREMNEAQFSRRIDTYLTLTRFKDVKTGTMDDAAFKDFRAKMRKIWKNKPPFILVDSAGSQDYDVDFIHSKVIQHKPDAVWIDGAYLLKASGSSHWEQQSNITRDLKQVALVENVPVIATTQVGRGAAGKKARIDTQHVSYSDTYGQDADWMIALNRIWDTLGQCWKNEVIAEIIKGRESESIKVLIKVDLDHMKIEESYAQITGDEPFDEESPTDADMDEAMNGSSMI